MESFRSSRELWWQFFCIWTLNIEKRDFAKTLRSAVFVAFCAPALHDGPETGVAALWVPGRFYRPCFSEHLLQFLLLLQSKQPFPDKTSKIQHDLYKPTEWRSGAGVWLGLLSPWKRDPDRENRKLRNLEIFISKLGMDHKLGCLVFQRNRCE